MVQKDLPDDKVLEVEPVIESTGLIRISDYPEQFGKLSDLFSAINSFKASRQIRLIPWLILAVLTFMATPIIFRFYIEFNGEATGRAWLDAAKIIFIYIAFVVGSILLLTG
ncbi:MAG: hypothetical protein K8F91_11660, partial [Candidatus Obscuribacterales bacterium]|nr:hypothetical protein [Candidatus Obscuribacterales bacterium]